MHLHPPTHAPFGLKMFHPFSIYALSINAISANNCCPCSVSASFDDDDEDDEEEEEEKEEAEEAAGGGGMTRASTYIMTRSRTHSVRKLV
jgi:hypothetical protein